MKKGNLETDMDTGKTPREAEDQSDAAEARPGADSPSRPSEGANTAGILILNF